MSRWTFVMSERDRSRILAWVQRAPAGFRIEIKETKRTLPQNDRFWAMLTDISAQGHINGRKFTPHQWKAIFLTACGQEVQFLPSLDGSSFIPYGNHSSDLSVSEMADVMEYMSAWAAENGVELHDPQAVAA